MGSSGSRPALPPVYAAQSPGRSIAKKKGKENILAPFLRSMSCGASSSSWRTDSFMQENRRELGDRLACQVTSDESTAGDEQSGPCEVQSSGQKSCSSSGQSLTISVQSSEHSLSSGIVGPSSPTSVASASYSLFRQRARNRIWHQADNQANGISGSQSDLMSLGASHGALHAEAPLNQFPCERSEVNSSSSLGSSLRVEYSSGDVSELDNPPNPEDLEGIFGPSQSPMCPDVDTATVNDQVTLNTQHSNDIGVLHVEAVGLVTQTLDESLTPLRGETSGREVRRNNRRRLWDALTRATSHRRRFSRSFLRASDDIDGLSNWNEDWGLFELNSSEEGSYTDESGFVMRRSSDMDERRWRSRPQVWALQHFSNAMEGSSGRSRHCAFGRHPNGHCLCEAFVMTEETSTRASISRIVMLAEALFDVLDEIHRQSVALSRSASLSLVSLPAPEVVVNSFAVRIHKKTDKMENVLDQCAECYICLVEYEEGDHVRVLPCCHEFHMMCVDKWLKEVHRVCPLCRGNVCNEIPRT